MGSNPHQDLCIYRHPQSKAQDRRTATHTHTHAYIGVFMWCRCWTGYELCSGTQTELTHERSDQWSSVESYIIMLQ